MNTACQTTREKAKEKLQFADVLNLKKPPAGKADNEASSFSDLGAWFSYGLPQTPKDGFTGPFIMSMNNGSWFSPSLSKLSIYLKDSVLLPGTAQAKNYRAHALPGRLYQRYEAGPLKVEQQLIFISANTALINTVISNTSSSPVSLTITWSGEPWIDQVGVSIYNERGVQYTFGPQHFRIQASGEINAAVDDLAYQLETNVEISQKPVSLMLAQTLVMEGNEPDIDKGLIQQVFRDSNQWFSKNNLRWQKWVRKATDGIKDSVNQMIAVKALETLTNNWRSSAGELLHQGLFPSYAYKGFNGFWSWDSWKHAAALAEINPALAKDQIRAMYDYQDEFGMVADCIFRDTAVEKHNWRDTKPPLSGWAIHKIFEATHDTSFVRELYPKLKKYHQWWYTNRDHDQNGLCEYGSTDGTRIAAAWESGMDNAVRFDNAKMVKNNAQAWSLSQESVDLNAYLYAEKKYMQKLAAIINQPTQQWQNEAERLKKKIAETFYDSASGYYYDVSLKGKHKIKVKGPEAWIPLWAGLATREQAEGVIRAIMDTTSFNTYMPFPTLNASHPKFNPQHGYWRGPVWLDQAYFALTGMKKYGYNAQADELMGRLLRNGEGIGIKGEPLRENYHPMTGKGLNARHFSWSAAHILLMLKE